MTEKIQAPKMSVSEVEKLIIELGRQKTPPEKIGLILRDQHGIPKAKLLGIRIGKILSKNKMDPSSAHKNIQTKIETLKSHFAKHKHDYTAQRKGVMYASRLKKIEKLSNQ